MMHVVDGVAGCVYRVVSSKEKMASDAARLEAELKKIKLHTQSLENTLEQKVMSSVTLFITSVLITGVDDHKVVYHQ